MAKATLTRDQIQEWRQWIKDDETNSITNDAIYQLMDTALRGLDDAEDAERYRWLREYDSQKPIHCVTGKYGDDYLDGAELDAAIDAALESEKEDSHE